MKRFLIAASLLTLGSLTMTACSSMPGMAAAPAQVREGVLADSKGMTLYVFDKDAAGSGKSMCNGPCANNWPPLVAGDTDKATGDWSMLTRDDGRKQWAYKGKPVYTWIKDQKPGDMSGDGFNTVWHTARP